MSKNSLVLAGCLLALTFTETHGASAQVRQEAPSPSADPLTLAEPLVLSGPDVGFRVVRMDGEIPIGQIVVRIKGAWVTAQTAK